MSRRPPRAPPRSAAAHRKSGQACQAGQGRRYETSERVADLRDRRRDRELETWSTSADLAASSPVLESYRRIRAPSVRRLELSDSRDPGRRGRRGNDGTIGPPPTATLLLPDAFQGRPARRCGGSPRSSTAGQ
jgi:hypothetical protein